MLRPISPRRACFHVYVKKNKIPGVSYVSSVLLSEIFTRGGMFSSVIVSLRSLPQDNISLLPEKMVKVSKNICEKIVIKICANVFFV